MPAAAGWRQIEVVSGIGTRAQGADELEAVGRAGKGRFHHDHVGPLAAGALERRPRFGGGDDVELRPPQVVPEDPGQIGIRLDQEHAIA